MNNDPTFLHRLRFGLVVFLMVLLAIGPFLHSHWGPSHVFGLHVSGLHVDEWHGVQHGASPAHFVATASQQSLGVTDDESPALGVETSLPQPDHDGFSLGHALCLLAVFLPLGMRQLARPHGVGAHPPAPLHAYQAGWPPPALAPPL